MSDMIRFVVAAALALAPLPASALSFDFSFGSYGGLVTGEVIGLTDNAESGASQVILDGFTGIGLTFAQPLPYDLMSDPFAYRAAQVWLTDGVVTTYNIKIFDIYDGCNTGGRTCFMLSMAGQMPGQQIFSDGNLSFLSILTTPITDPHVTAQMVSTLGLATFTAIPDPVMPPGVDIPPPSIITADITTDVVTDSVATPLPSAWVLLLGGLSALGLLARRRQRVIACAPRTSGCGKRCKN